MKSTDKALKTLAILGTLGVVVGTSACAHVGREEYDAGMASLRDDMTRQMQEGDEAVANRLNARVDGVEGRLAQLEQDLQALENEFGVTVERLETALRFNTPVHFGFDNAALDAEAEEILSRFSQVAQEYYPEARITVEGFTDPSGPAEYNLRLGQRRADAVMNYLTANTGMAPDRVKAVSYGEDTSRLVTTQGGQMVGRENRRVVLVIDHNGEIPAGATIAGAEGTRTKG